MSKLFTEEIHSKQLTPAQKAELGAFFDQNCSFTADFERDSTFVVVHDGAGVVFSFNYMVGKLRRGAFIEIYNVCTLVSRRRQGIARKVLEQFIQDKLDEHIIWLGVLPEKSAPFKLYTSLGFTNPRLTNKSPLGTIYPFRFISLVYNPFADASDRKTAERECAHIVDAVANMKSSVARKPLLLNYQIFEQSMNNLLREDVEIGGELQALADKSLGIASVYRGQAGSLTVQMPHAPFVYHTHPLHAYIMTAYGLGTPSAQDFAFSAHPIVSVHLVLAIEGSYLIQYSADFRMLATFMSVFNPPCYQALEKALLKLFEDEYFRHVSYITGPLIESVPISVLSISQAFKGQVKHIIKYYLEAVNNCKLADIVNKYSDSDAFKRCVLQFTDLLDYKICRAVFIPSEVIEKNVMAKQNLLVPEIKM